MALSGNSTFTVTRDNIIKQAGLLVNAIPLTGTMGAQVVNDFAFNLNAMVKNWQSTGIHVWTTTDVTLFPQVGQVRYQAGPGATDHITESYIETAITTDEATGQTTLSVDSTVGMTVGDFAGVVLDDGTLQWSPILVITATTITVTTALTDSASATNPVFTYTSKIPRPLAMVDARKYDIAGATDTPIIVTARKDYFALPLKTSAGEPVQVFYDPQLALGNFYIWQVPSIIDSLIKMTVHRPIMNFDTASNNPDLPEEWVLPLIYNLADVMQVRYPVPPNKSQMISNGAEKYLSAVMGFDREGESIFVYPSQEW